MKARAAVTVTGRGMQRAVDNTFSKSEQTYGENQPVLIESVLFVCFLSDGKRAT